MPPLSSDASKWNNVSTLGLNLRDFGQCVSVDVAACARPMLSTYTGSNNDLRGDNSCSIILPTLHLCIHNEGQLLWQYRSSQKSKNSNKLGKTHVLKRDFFATLQGGSSSSPNESGWDDWQNTRFWYENSRSGWSMLLKIRSLPYKQQDGVHSYDMRGQRHLKWKWKIRKYSIYVL